LYPCFIGDFKYLSLPNLWETPYASTSMIREKSSYHSQAVIWGSIFLYSGAMVTLSIIQTIRTNPGGIPQVKEWDIITSDTQSESSDDENRSMRSEGHSRLSIKREEEGNRE
jgi:hypothetical protein